MTDFYRYRHEHRPAAPQVVCAVHDDQLLCYVANTKLWHRDPYFESLLVFNDSHWMIEPIDQAKAVTLVEATPRIDGRGHGAQVLREYRDQPAFEKATSAELGLVTERGERPIAGGDVPELLATLEADQKRIVARYPAERRGAAVNFAHEINTGKKKALSGLSVWARTSDDGREVIVELRRCARTNVVEN